MASYEAVRPWAEGIVDAIADGRMPPFAEVDTDECATSRPWKYDPRLTEEERSIVEIWATSGALEGQPATLPMPPPQTLSDPDLEVSILEPFTVPAGEDLYQCFRIPLGTTETKWMKGLDIYPDNGAVVHHVLVWHDPTDASAERVGADGSYPCTGQPDVTPADLVGVWTPGSPPVRNPEGVGTQIEAGASLVVNIHYHPTDRDEVDQTGIGVAWTDGQPDEVATWFMVDMPFGAEVQPGPGDSAGEVEFRIPAGESAHRETLVYDTTGVLAAPVPVFAVMPHMHFRGTEMQVVIDRPGGEDECLIEVQDYRFDYQNAYAYDVSSIQRMPTVWPGDRVQVRCTYDNSWSNPFMSEALEASDEADLVDVYWGEDTADEMCMAILGLVMPAASLR